MTELPFFERPYVKRLQEIFGHPSPPKSVTERQFDQRNRELRTLAKAPWSEIEHGPYAEYLLDLAYVELQQDLFDYLFPGLLAMWVDGLSVKLDQPCGETDFYYSIWKGRVLERMLSPSRRGAVLSFVADEFLAAVERAPAEPASNVSGMDASKDHSFFLTVFNAIGQSIPVIPKIWGGLEGRVTPGSARFWLLLATGLCYKPSQAPWIDEWTPNEGGGGVYVLTSNASIFDQGFDPDNLEFMRRTLDRGTLQTLLNRALGAGIEDHEAERLRACLSRLQTEPTYVDRKIAWYLDNIGKPDLGGVIDYI